MIPILMYHQIGEPSPRGTPYRGLTVHPRDFRRQMLWLRRLGYRGLSMARLIPYLRGEKHGKVVGITFDDGYANVLENAVPVLEECGFLATNYFVVRQLGGSNVWDADEGVPPSPLMDAAGLRAWAAAGHEVGSHTLNHPDLSRISPELAVNEIRDSREALEQIAGAPVRAFCYPYGHFNAALAAVAREAGYDSATTTARGLARLDDDPYALPRVAVMRSTHLLRFLQKCLTRLEDNKRIRNEQASRPLVPDAAHPPGDLH
ncbi:polysaccharide deacetylase family protein [Castellaniella ginsengisoli]|jgi:peptidoglycan/xylan/chitin deacetylase (PgdA/CDA1 family)|uniref:Polysaccharide deacetylase family protein n=1 Tax=Castellaniella ginsengisoli TaxID=546114 RepID=A0AB39EZG7_9BURK